MAQEDEQNSAWNQEELDFLASLDPQDFALLDSLEAIEKGKKTL